MELLVLDTNNKVSIAPAALMIPEFAIIWKNDFSPAKEFALRDLAYIYFICDYNSVYRSYDPDKREKQLKRDLGIRKLSAQTRKGVEKYKELQDTPSIRFLESGYKVMEETMKYFNNVNYAKTDNNGAIMYKVGEVLKCLKDVSGTMDTIDGLLQKAKTESQAKDRIRGGGDTGAFEDLPQQILKKA